MKGLLLKDWYMMRKYCRIYLVSCLGFLFLSLLDTENMFFVFYPCLLTGIVPVNLLGYDERSRWLQYSGTLPYTRAQIVSGKYLIGLFGQAAVLLITGIVQSIRMAVNGNFVPGELFILMLLMLTVAAITSSITLPFIFKLGVEKGRAAYYVMVGFVCAASVVITNLFQEPLQTEIRPNLLLLLSAAAAMGIYALSWYLSVVFFRKREL